MKIKTLSAFLGTFVGVVLIASMLAPTAMAAPVLDDPQPTEESTPQISADFSADLSEPDPLLYENEDVAVEPAAVEPLNGGNSLFMPLIVKIGSTSKLLNAIKVDTGYDFACALLSNGGVKCWGYNNSGQLGNGTAVDQPYPTYVTGLDSNVKDIALGYGFACALTTDGLVMCWGENSDGQLGNGVGADEATPVYVSGLPGNIQAITAGWYHACAVTADHAVMCWGKNNVGQLGNNEDGYTGVTPVYASGLLTADVSGDHADATIIAAGSYHTCAIDYKDEVECWGYNSTGQLGDDSSTTRLVPTKVYNLSSIREVSAGNAHTCAVTYGGTVRCWGWNYYGQLGNNSNSDSDTQVKVYGISSGALHVSTGTNFTCMSTTMYKAKCWGLNNYGQLGNNSTTKSNVPVNVTNLTSTANNVSASVDFACAVTTEGGIQCWGRNTHYQLGNQSTIESHIPVDVMALQD